MTHPIAKTCRSVFDGHSNGRNQEDKLAYLSLADLSRAQKENEKFKSDLIAAKWKFDEISSKSSASSELEAERR